MASFVLPIVSGLAGLFGGLSPQKMTQTTNSTSSGTQSSSGSSSTTPQLSDLQQLLSSIMGPAAVNQYQQGTNLTPYVNSGLQNINNTTNSASGQIANTLAARGLSNSPYAATAMTQPQLMAQQEQSSLLNSVPLLQQQLNTQNIGTMESAFSALPTGTSTSGTSNTSTTGTQNGTTTTVAPGNILSAIAGALGGGAAGGILSGLFG